MKTKSPFALCLRHRRMPYAFFITLCLFLSFLCFSQGVSINTTGAEADNSAALDISSTNQGLLIPRLTTANRPASPATGLIIYNTDCNDLQYYNGSSWISVKTSLVAPVATSGTSATQNQFTANWSASDGATSYYLDVSTSSGFGSLVTGFNNNNAGNVTTCIVTGLSGNTAYYYRLRANNSCNLSSNSNTISVTTANLAANIVAYWKFEGNSNDATGNSHTGTDHTITYNSTYGKIDQGGLFTRTVPSYIDLGTAFDYAASAFTISAWAYPTVNTLQD
ncbi:MAG: hypothetical protein HGB12_00005, partial [Bacteroidetes bacterium]|nr:hypothetical protein [Bacteroidota bacterium]